MERSFGACSNHGECEVVCPRQISIDDIAFMNRDYRRARFKNRRPRSGGAEPVTA